MARLDDGKSSQRKSLRSAAYNHDLRHATYNPGSASEHMLWL